jgi:hypothetical protein
VSIRARKLEREREKRGEGGRARKREGSNFSTSSKLSAREGGRDSEEGRGSEGMLLRLGQLHYQNLKVQSMMDRCQQ